MRSVAAKLYIVASSLKTFFLMTIAKNFCILISQDFENRPDSNYDWNQGNERVCGPWMVQKLAYQGQG
ncbi:hypothetical protein C1H46_024617 [Malus baccata]|uniref:Uncharacterized protein n=1 Tax=Malus baccata TaxID=106549 RepID=A0A540LTL1_MALBA|nr:hypothetical protein C1H46_024617 [Malus baccata]